MRGAFDAIPFTALFPGLSPSDADAMLGAARALDAARRHGGGAGEEWSWFEGHAVFPGPSQWTPVILGLDVLQDAGGGDQLEFQLQVVWTAQGRLAVDSAVNVACWCDTEHATHDVDALRISIGADTSLAEAFRTGTARLVRWLSDPHDADFWRARAALPPRW